MGKVAIDVPPRAARVLDVLEQAGFTAYVVAAAQTCSAVAKRIGCKQSEMDLLATAVQKRTQMIATEFGV